MTPLRGGFPAALALAVTSAGTTWLAFFSWQGFTEQSARFLGPLLVLAAVIAVSGAAARWARVPAPLVVLVQILLAGALTSSMLCGSPVPVGPAWTRLVESLNGAVTSAQQYASPVPATADGVHPLLILGGLACLLLVDLLACTLRRVPLAGLPLLTVYSVPVSLLVGGVSWWVFAITAAGFLTMLFLQVNEQLARWGRPLGTEEASDPTGFGVRTGTVRASAGTIGAVATALAIFLPLLIPTMDLNLLTGGTGSGDGDIVIENPTADLRRNLSRGDDIPLIQVRTDDPDPEYLRISVLNRFQDNEWSSGDREVPTNQLANGVMPDLQGVAGTIARREYDYDVSVNASFRSLWLPTQAPISSIDAAGDWRYDVTTMDFLSGERGMTTAGMRYSMTGVKLELSAESMAQAGSSGGQVDSEYIELPDGFPAVVNNLAFQVTRNAVSRFEKAQVLQDWFREEGGFTYDINADQGNGTDDLVRFLTEGEGGRTGYCEQFASAMAVMARSVGIPSRIAIGFLEPQEIGRGTWEYSAHDMHAWPELYFPGSGWVMFEPTPPGRAEGVPGYTTERVPETGEEEAPPVPRQDDELPDRGDSESASPSEANPDASEGDDAGAIAWFPVIGGLSGALLVTGLLLTPRGLRRRQARNRLGAGPEAAWLELRDTARDLRVPWPPDRSPRETRNLLVEHLGAPVDENTPERPVHGPEVAPDAVSALDLIVHAVERLRYARSGEASAPPLRAELETVIASLHGGATRRARRRAQWWPASVVTRQRRVSRGGVGGLITARHGGVVDHVG